MINRRNLLKLVTTAAVCSPLSIYANSVGLPNKTEFKIYDELFYNGKPDLTHYGLSPIHVAYTWQLWGERQFNGDIENTPPIEALKSYPKRYGLIDNPPKIVVLDIEHWKHYGNISESTLKKNIQKYITCINIIRSVLPKGTLIAYYNIGAQPNFGKLLDRELTTKELSKWKRSNDLVQPIVEKSDIMFPACYYRSTYSYEGWERKTKYFINESRRLGEGKPVIPFIWPQYSDIEPFQNIPGTIWDKKLRFLYENSDSLVLWRRARGPKASDWNESADWWRATIKFISDNSI